MYQVAKISITCLAVAFVLLLAQGMDAKENRVVTVDEKKELEGDLRSVGLID